MAFPTFRHKPQGSVAGDRLWVGAKRWGTAVALSLFPFVFILDGQVESMSPVLPGVALVALGIALFPLAAMELAVWRNRHEVDEKRRESIASRYAWAGGIALLAALGWVGSWFWGVV